MDWFRWWQGTVNDPKFRAIARRSRQPISLVIACWAYLLEDANENGNSGDSFDAETCAACLDAEPDDIQAIIDALTDKGLLDEGQLTHWEKRQPKREDDSSERVRRYREKKRNETHATEDVTQCNADVTHGNAPDTETDTEKDINTTSPNARESDLPPLPEIARNPSDWVRFFQRMGYPLFQVKTAENMTRFQSWCDRQVTFRTAVIGIEAADEKNGRKPDKPKYYLGFIEEAITAANRLNANLKRKENGNGQHGSRRYSPNEAVRIARERRADAGHTIDVLPTELDG